jgi:hypothetical protein
MNYRFFILTFFVSYKLFAQDTIVLQTGVEIKSKIFEISAADVKYKKFDNLNGPSYTTLKTDIFMIKYENGSRDVLGISNKNTSASNSEPTNYGNKNQSGNTNNNDQVPQNDQYMSKDPTARLASDMVFVQGNDKVSNFYICKVEVTQELFM